MKRILIITTIALGTLMIQPQAGPITRILMGEKMEKAASQKTTTPTQKAPIPETNPISTTAPVVKTDTDFDDSKTETNIDFLIENKIKKLLEMTETETTQTS